MAQSARPDREIEAQAAAERAMAGELPLVGMYSLQLQANRYSITVPPSGPRNASASKEDQVPAYVDFQNGFVVYDLNAPESGDGDECDE